MSAPGMRTPGSAHTDFLQTGRIGSARWRHGCIPPGSGEMDMPFLQDVRHGFRTLRRAPGLVLVAVVTLALGIGANTAIFSVTYSVLLKPLVFPEPERLVQVWMAFPERGIERTSWSHANFWDARD